MSMTLPSSAPAAEPPSVAAALTVVERWRTQTLATIDATVHTATPSDMDWLSGRMAALDGVLQLLAGGDEPPPSLVQDHLG